MGSRSSKSSSSSIFREYERALKGVRQEHLKTSSSTIRWKDFLRKKLSDLTYTETPHWGLIKKSIENWLDSDACNHSNYSWLINAQFFEIHSSGKNLRRERKAGSTIIDFNSVLISKEGSSPGWSSSSLPHSLRATVTGCDTLLASSFKKSSSVLRPSPLSRTYQPGKAKSEGLNTEATESITASPSLDLDSVKTENISASQFTLYSPKQSSRLASEELKSFLRKELALPNHPVSELVKVFQKAYEAAIFKRKVKENRVIASNEEVEKITNEALLPVKRMLRLLREFTNVIYNKVIESYLKELKDEDEDHRMIIDQLICQLMFDDTRSLLYQYIIECLQNRFKEQIRYFANLATASGGKCLHEIDSQFKEKFMLLDSRVPYNTVIKTVHLLQKISNPYMKKDYISTMEREMMESIFQELHKKNLQEEVHLEPDDKFTIYTYCLLKSDYANVVVDIAFIEEFTLPEDTNQAYARFKGCLQDYILSGDFVSFMKKEEQNKLLLGGQNSPLKCCCKTSLK